MFDGIHLGNILYIEHSNAQPLNAFQLYNLFGFTFLFYWNVIGSL